MINSAGSSIVWTRQVPQVWEELQQTGVYVVQDAYVREKNGAISDYYIGLYRWYTEQCRRYLHIPAHLELPIWLALTEKGRLPLTEGTISLTLEIPRGQMCILDYDKWGYRVNDWYVPLDAQDELRHNEELRRCGIANEALLIMSDKGNYYPQLRQKIIRSWERLFTQPSPDPDCNVGTVWELRREWVKEVQFYEPQ